MLQLPALGKMSLVVNFAFHNLKDWVILSVNGGKVGFGMFAVGGVRCAHAVGEVRCAHTRSLMSLSAGERDYVP